MKKGFTLAETLITLVIVGVVAALTVPSLIAKYQEQQTISRLKKVYSTLAQATNRIIAEEGTPINWVTTTDNVYNLYKKYLINLKDCNSSSGCFAQGAYKKLNGTIANNWDNDSRYRKFILQDGTQIMIDSYLSQNCETSDVVDMGSKHFCAYMWADLNGEKGPNQHGKDVFCFVIQKNGFYPAGCDIDGKCTKNHFGAACACKVLRENAINY